MKNVMILALFVMGSCSGVKKKQLTPKAALWQAIKKQDLRTIGQLCEKYEHCPEKLVYTYDLAPLHLAIEQGKQKAFTFLLDETLFGTTSWLNTPRGKARVGRYSYPMTPFQYLVWSVHRPIYNNNREMFLYMAKKLLAAGANIDLKWGLFEATPLWYATYSSPTWGVLTEDVPLVQFLLQCGADKIKSTYINPRHPIDIYMPQARAHKSGFLQVEQLLKNDKEISLLERFIAEKDAGIQEVLYSNILIQESWEHVQQALDIKFRSKIKGEQKLERDAIEQEALQFLIDRRHLARVSFFLENDVSFDERQEIAIIYLAKQYPRSGEFFSSITPLGAAQLIITVAQAAYRKRIKQLLSALPQQGAKDLYFHFDDPMILDATLPKREREELLLLDIKKRKL